MKEVHKSVTATFQCALEGSKRLMLVLVQKLKHFAKKLQILKRRLEVLVWVLASSFLTSNLALMADSPYVELIKMQLIMLERQGSALYAFSKKLF